MTAISSKNLFGRTYRFYNRNIYPVFEGVRGFSRPAIELRKQALKRKGLKNNKIEIRDEVLELAELEHFVSLVDENKFVEKFFEIVDEDTVVADLGACKGFYSCIASAITEEKVYGFEFAPENLKDFRKNKDLNDLENLKIVDKAVSDSSGQLQAGIGSHGTNSIGNGDITVESVSLDEFFNDREAPDVLKVDVEGAELKALKGAKKVLESEPDILLELHQGKRLEGFTHDSEQVLDYLEDFGYFFNEFSRRDGSRMIFASTDYSKMDGDGDLPPSFEGFYVNSQGISVGYNENRGLGQVFNSSFSAPNINNEDVSIELDVESHYEHLILKYTYRNSTGHVVGTYEDVYSGEKPDLLAVDYSTSRYNSESHGGQNTYIFDVSNLKKEYLGDGNVRLSFTVERNDLTKELFKSSRNPRQESKFIDFFNDNYLFRDSGLTSSSYDMFLGFTEDVSVTSLGDSLKGKRLESKNLMAVSNSRITTVVKLQDFRSGGVVLNDAVTVEVESSIA